MLGGLVKLGLGGAQFAHALSLQFEAVCAVQRSLDREITERSQIGAVPRAGSGSTSGAGGTSVAGQRDDPAVLFPFNPHTSWFGAGPHNAAFFIFADAAYLQNAQWQPICTEIAPDPQTLQNNRWLNVMLRNAPVFSRPNSLIGQHANMSICCHREKPTEQDRAKLSLQADGRP